MRDIREGATPGREEHPGTWRGAGRVCMEVRGLTEPCVCVPQELDNQYSPSRWVIRLGAEEAMRTYSKIGDEGTGGPLCGRFGWTLACGSGSRCWGREEEPHSPSLSRQFPKSRYLICLEALAAGLPGGGRLRDCAPHPCLISQPANYANQPTSQLCPGLKATVAQGSRVKKGRSPTQLLKVECCCYLPNQRSFFFFNEIRAWESVSY